MKITSQQENALKNEICELMDCLNSCFKDFESDNTDKKQALEKILSHVRALRNIQQKMHIAGWHENE